MRTFKGSRTKKGEAKWIRSGLGFQVLTADSHYSVCELNGKRGAEEQIANAQLIAAAPEILHRLQSVQLTLMAHPDYVLGRNQEFIDQVSIIEETINKALGINE